MDTNDRALLTFYPPAEHLNRARNAAYALGVSVADLMKSALLSHLQVVEAKNGGPFPVRANSRAGCRLAGPTARTTIKSVSMDPSGRRLAIQLGLIVPAEGKPS